MTKEKFFEDKMAKAGSTLKGIAGLVTQSFEVEAMTTYSESTISSKLGAIGRGFATQEHLNDGNGWNNDVHHDGSLTSYSNDNGGIYGTETSASPIDLIGWDNLKLYLNGILDTYKQASGGVYHTKMGSVHVHNTVSYMYDRDRHEYASTIKLDNKPIYNTVAKFFIKFMPVMKWLVMTDKRGARGVRGSSYDLLNNDDLFYWWRAYGRTDDANNVITPQSNSYLSQMSRDSYLRIFSGIDYVHFENRMCDTTFNATHLAMWLSINKAITLLAIDFSRNGLKFNFTENDVELSYELMQQHRRGYDNVDRTKLEQLYKEFVSYLAKYLKVINSLEAVEVMDKLIKCPISQWLTENGHDTHWNTELIERVFNTRNRASDDTLREKFLVAIKSMSVPFADSLNEFHENMAMFLDVEEKKVKSLYQMFKRENVDIEFLGGRLIYMGD